MLLQMTDFAPGAQNLAGIDVGVSAAVLALRRLRHDAPQGPLYENMTSFTKPEVQNISQRRQMRTEPRSQSTCRKNLVKFSLMVSEICERRDRQTDRLITILCTPSVGEIVTHATDICLHCLFTPYWGGRSPYINPREEPHDQTSIFYVFCIGPPPPAALRYAMYFRFCG